MTNRITTAGGTMAALGMGSLAVAAALLGRVHNIALAVVSGVAAGSTIIGTGLVMKGLANPEKREVSLAESTSQTNGKSRAEKARADYLTDPRRTLTEAEAKELAALRSGSSTMDVDYF